MGRVLILILVAVGLAAYLKQRGAAEPGTIDRPVYMALRMQLKAGPRAVDVLFFVKAADKKDCGRQRDQLMKGLEAGQKQSPAEFHLQSDECLSELEKRFALLFEDLPMPVTYFSSPRSKPQEREIRAMFLGVSRDESDQICDLLIKDIGRLTSAARCIPAPR